MTGDAGIGEVESVLARCERGVGVEGLDEAGGDELAEVPVDGVLAEAEAVGEGAHARFGDRRTPVPGRGRGGELDDERERGGKSFSISVRPPESRGLAIVG